MGTAAAGDTDTAEPGHRRPGEAPRENFGFYLERNEEPRTGFAERSDLKK